MGNMIFKSTKLFKRIRFYFVLQFMISSTVYNIVFKNWCRVFVFRRYHLAQIFELKFAYIEAAFTYLMSVKILLQIRVKSSAENNFTFMWQSPRNPMAVLSGRLLYKSIIVYKLNFSPLAYPRTTDTQRELFFKNSKFLGLGRQIGPKFYEAFGLFLAKL